MDYFYVSTCLQLDIQTFDMSKNTGQVERGETVVCGLTEQHLPTVGLIAENIMYKQSFS